MKIISLGTVIVPLAVLLMAACNKSVPATDGAPTPLNDTGSEVVAVSVGSDGFQPSSVHGNKGQKLSLQFTRTTDETCATSLSFPELGITKELPLNEPVTLDIPTVDARTLTFQCGMGMYKSSVVIH